MIRPVNAMGIILAGGSGTRMAPMTTSVSKQLVPVYDKPMIFYPLTTLMEAGIRDVIVVSQNEHIRGYMKLLRNGEPFGMDIVYAEQNEPRGIAEALVIAAGIYDPSRFDKFCLILGDNIFHAADLSGMLNDALGPSEDQAVVFLTQVKDPQRYGVAELSPELRITDIEEKPQEPKSAWAVTGLYAYPAAEAAAIARNLEPSGRGELEITDVNRNFMRRGRLGCKLLLPGSAWLDSGTPLSLLDAAQYVHAIQERQGRMVGCPEEAAYRNGWITADALKQRAQEFPNSYGDYLYALAAAPSSIVSAGG